MSGTWLKLSSVTTSATLTEGKHKVVTPVTAVYVAVFQINGGRSQHQNYFIVL